MLSEPLGCAQVMQVTASVCPSRTTQANLGSNLGSEEEIANSCQCNFGKVCEGVRTTEAEHPQNGRATAI